MPAKIGNVILFAKTCVHIMPFFHHKRGINTATGPPVVERRSSRSRSPVLP